MGTDQGTSLLLVNSHSSGRLKKGLDGVNRVSYSNVAGYNNGTNTRDSQS